MHGESLLTRVAAGGVVVLGGGIARADTTRLSRSRAMIIRQQADTQAHALASRSWDKSARRPVGCVVQHPNRTRYQCGS
jgi:hypothetical protein